MALTPSELPPLISLSELVEDSLALVKTINQTLENEQTILPEEENKLVEDSRRALEGKCKAYISDPRRLQPASADTLARLDKLRREIKKRETILDAFQQGLKEFELEASLRLGPVNKRDLAAAKLGHNETKSPQNTIVPSPNHKRQRTASTAL